MSLWHHCSYGLSQHSGNPPAFVKEVPAGGAACLAAISGPLSTHISICADHKTEIYLLLQGQPDQASIASLPAAGSVAERLLKHYQQVGHIGLLELQGAFALCIYDAGRQQSLLYRPFLNGLPLFYVHTSQGLSVAGNPQDLLSFNQLSGKLDEFELARIFKYASSNWQETVLSEVSAVGPGQLLVINSAQIEEYSVNLETLLPALEFGSYPQALSDYRALLQAAVNKRLQKGRSHALMLSSGLDSGSLLVLANRSLKEPPLQAFSWALPGDSAGDESQNISVLCKALKVPLQLFDGNAYGPFGQLDNPGLVPTTPYTNPFWYLTDALYQRAADAGVEVLLNGNFADVLVLGPRYIFADIFRDRQYSYFLPMLYRLMRQTGIRGIRNSPALVGLARSLYPRKAERRTQFKAETWMPVGANIYAQLHRLERESNLAPAYERFATALSPFQSGYPGVERYLSAPYGIERIEPHRDIELLNYSLRLPAYWHYRRGQMKGFIRDALQGMLPENIRQQPRAGDLAGLVSRSYMRNRTRIRERLLDQPDDWSPYVDQTWLTNCLNTGDPIIYRDALLVWQCLNLQAWKAKYIHNLNKPTPK